MTETHKNPYIGPRTFQRNEGHLFFGREREAQDLAALVASERLVLFYAQSGAGKSSLINTRLIPDLEAKGYEVLPVGRVSGDLAAGQEVDNIFVYNLMRSWVQQEMDSAAWAQVSLPGFLAKLNTNEQGYFYDDSPIPEPLEGDELVVSRRALIIDQFEELLTTHPEAWAKRDDFFIQLARAMVDDPYLWVVLVMREDYIAMLDPYAHLLSGGLRVRYYMQRLGREAALRAVKKPVDSLRPYARGVAEKLVDDLCSVKVLQPGGNLETQPGQYVEPVQLQVVCYNLWENLSLHGTEITERDLEEVGDVNQSLGNYYAGRVKAVAEARNVKERKIREWFADKLISAGGVRNMVLQEPHGKTGGLAHEVIESLHDLIRAEQRGGAIFYELTHDRLVEPVIENNRVWLEEHLSPLQRQAALWMDQGQNETWLLSDQALLEVEEWAKDHPDEITEVETEFLEACRKLQSQLDERREMQQRELEFTQRLAKEQALSAKRAMRFSIVAIILVIFALLASVLAFQQRRTARLNEQTAKENEARVQVLLDTARARELASLANTQQLDLSMLLSVEAYNIQPENRDAQKVLFENGLRSTRLVGFLANSINPANEFIFSPNGRFLAAIKTVEKQDRLFVWDLTQITLEGREIHNEPVSRFFFTPDNAFLVYLDRDGLTIWDLENQRVSKTLNEHVGAVTQVLVRPDGSFATLGENGDATLWTTDLSNTNTSVPRGDVIAVSPDGRRIASFSIDTISFWNVSPDDPQPAPAPIERDPYSVVSLAFSPDGNLLAISDKDNNVAVWDFIQNQETNIPLTPGTRIEKVAINASGDLILFHSADGVRILDGKTGQQKEAPLPAEDFTLSPDGSLLFTRLRGGPGSDYEITLYDAMSGQQIGSSLLSGSLAVFSPDAKTMAIFSEVDRRVILLNAQTAERLTDITVQDSSVSNIAFSDDGLLLALGTEDGSVTVWNLNDRTLSASDSSDTSQVTSMAFQPGGNQLIIGRRNSSISIWDLSEKQPETREAGYPGRIRLVDLSPNGGLLYSVGSDGIILLDTATFQTTGLILTNSFVPGMEFRTESSIFVVFDKDQIILWNMESGEQKRIEGDFDLSATQLSTKGGVLITTDTNGKKTLWNAQTGGRFSALDIPEASYVTISPDDRFVVTSDISTGVINLFQEISTGAISEQLNGLLLYDPRPYSSISKYTQPFSPSGNILVTSGINQLSLWDIATGAPEPIAEALDASGVVAFNEQETRLITYLSSTSMYALWDLKTLEKTEQLLSSPPQISADGRFVAGLPGGLLTVVDFKTGEPVEIPNTTYADVLDFDPEGKLLVTATTFNGMMSLWAAAKMEPMGQPIQASYIDLEGQFLVGRSMPGDTISMFDVSSGRQVGGPIRGVSGPIGNVTFNRNGDIRAFRSEGNTKEESTVTLSGNDKFLGADPRDALVISPDHKHFVIFGPDGGLTLWNVSAPSLPANTVMAFDEQITSETMSPNGKTLASSSKEGVALWDTAQAELLGKLESQHIREAAEAYLSPEKNTLVINNGDGTLSIRDLETGEPVGEPMKETFCGFSPDGSIVVTIASGSAYAYPSLTNYTYSYYCYPGSSDYAYGFWDASTGELIGDRLAGDSNSNTSYVFSETSRYMMLHAAGKLEFQILEVVHDAEGIQLVPLGDPVPGTFQRFVSGDRFVLSYEGNNFSLWETAPKEDKRVPVSSVSVPVVEQGYAYLWAISPIANSAILYSYHSPSGTASFYRWDMDRDAGLEAVRDLNGYILSPNGQYFAGSTGTEKILFDLSTGNELPLPGNPAAFSRDNQYLAVADTLGITSAVNILSTRDGKTINDRPLSGYFSGFGGQNNEIVFISRDRGYVRYNLQTGEEIEPSLRADGLTFSPDGQFVAAYTNRGSVSVWKPSGTNEIVAADGQIIGFSADNKTLITTTTSENITDIALWDLVNGEKRESSMEYPGVVTGYRLNDNQSKLAIFGNQGLYVWDLVQPDREPQLFLNRTGDVARMVFSPDNKTLVTIGNDGALLWDVSKRARKSDLLQGNTGRIVDLAFTKDSKHLFYVDSSGAVFKVSITETVHPPTEPIRKLEGACRITLSSDGTFLAYKAGKNLHVWNLQKSSQDDYILNIGENTSVSCNGPIAFSVDENSLAFSEHTGTYDRIYVYTFDESGAILRKAELRMDDIPSYSLQSLTFALDNTILAATGSDGRISFWDTSTRNLLGILDQPGSVKRFANGQLEIYFPAERRLIQMPFEDNAWKELLQNWQADLCRKAGRPLTPEEWDTYFPEVDYPANPSCPMPASAVH